MEGRKGRGNRRGEKNEKDWENGLLKISRERELFWRFFLGRGFTWFLGGAADDTI